MQKPKGFTLIELLVVIAIIGILSGLIIVSMNGATTSAKDSRVKSEMDQLRTVAAVYYINHSNSYGTLTTNGTCGGTYFATEGDGENLLVDINSQSSGATVCWGSTTSLTTYCLKKVLNDGTSWCIDSAGRSGVPGATGCSDATHNLCNN